MYHIISYYIVLYRIISYYLYKHTISYVLSYSYDRHDDLGKRIVVPWASPTLDEKTLDRAMGVSQQKPPNINIR